MTNNVRMEGGVSAEAEASRLCLACGLCCQGVFHSSAMIRADETRAVERLGLEVVETDGRPGFPLPCRHHQEGRCAVYRQRPHVCKAYRCKLLVRFLDGRSSWEESLLRIGQVKKLAARLGLEGGPEDLWRQWQAIRENEISGVPDREHLTDLVSLLVLSRSHFLWDLPPSKEIHGG